MSDAAFFLRERPPQGFTFWKVLKLFLQVFFIQVKKMRLIIRKAVFGYLLAIKFFFNI